MKRLSTWLALAAGLLLGVTVAVSPTADAVTSVPARLARKFEGGIQFRNDVAVNGTLAVDGAFKPASVVPAPASKVTIASGVITVSQLVHTVETQAAASSDDLDTISGGTAEQLLILRPFSDAHDVVIKHGTGNIECPGASDITLAEDDDYAVLAFTGAKWAVLATKLKASGGAMIAANVSIADVGNLIAASDVEGALQELAQYKADLGSTANGKGASRIAVENASGLGDIGITNVQNGFEAMATYLSAGGGVVHADDLQSTTSGHGASTVGVEDAAGLITASNAEGAFAELAQFKADLGSTANGKGASLVKIEAITHGAGTDVQAQLADLVARVYALEHP